MRLVIVGASGLIGSAVRRLARQRGIPHIGTAHSRRDGDLVAFDIRRDRLSAAIPELGPDDVVYLLSAYISPSWIHQNPDEAKLVNIDGTRRAIDDAREAGARVVFMSTDQVFDGTTDGATEETPTAPLNLYGRMKREIEEHVERTCANAAIARTGWNVGWDWASHCVVKQTYETLLGPDAAMATDNSFNVTDVNDTAAGLLALAQRRPRTIFHLAATPAVVRSGLARRIVSTSRLGAEMQFREVSFREIGYTEGRPRSAWLENRAAREALGIRFRSPLQVIDDKVALLDDGRELDIRKVAS